MLTEILIVIEYISLKIFRSQNSSCINKYQMGSAPLHVNSSPPCNSSSGTVHKLFGKHYV